VPRVLFNPGKTQLAQIEIRHAARLMDTLFVHPRLRKSKTKNPITPGDFSGSFELEKQSTKKNGRLVPARLVVRLLL
jgi:hypothetical protein